MSHPAPIVVSKATQVDGAIVVAKKGKTAAIIGGLIVGGILLNEAAKAEERRARRRERNRRRRYEEDYRPRHTGGGSYERCADRYRSFRYSDGTYQPYGGGPREVCPYLY